MKTIYQTDTPEKTIELGVQLASRLAPGSTVLLFGDLGSGKTHFVKGIAKGLGISETIKSPTFTYVNEYPIKSNSSQFTAHSFYHYDLYRLKHGEDFTSIGLEETLHDSHAINVIEWADRLAGRHPQVFVSVTFVCKADHHEIAIQWEDTEIVPEELAEKFRDDWATPQHVRAHCQKVTEVCLQIGQAYAKENVLVNLGLLHTAGLLHDMARVCDFTELRRDRFGEKVTDEKWEKWVDCRTRYKGLHHAEVAARALADEGYLKTARLIRLHNSLSILEEPEQLDPVGHLEATILFYADKRVKHDEIVSLAERFRDGRERYGEHDDSMTRSRFEEVEKRTYELEKRLFSSISLNPGDIR